MANLQAYQRCECKLYIQLITAIISRHKNHFRLLKNLEVFLVICKWIKEEDTLVWAKIMLYLLLVALIPQHTNCFRFSIRYKNWIWYELLSVLVQIYEWRGVIKLAGINSSPLIFVYLACSFCICIFVNWNSCHIQCYMMMQI